MTRLGESRPNQLFRGEGSWFWEFVNSTAQSHPIHLHLESFQVLDRTGSFGEIPLEDYEQGWEDTFTVGAGETVRIMTRFDQFTGTFVWHCHILEHEDHEMMRPFRITAVPEPSAWMLLFLVPAMLANRRGPKSKPAR